MDESTQVLTLITSLLAAATEERLISQWYNLSEAPKSSSMFPQSLTQTSFMPVMKRERYLQKRHQMLRRIAVRCCWQPQVTHIQMFSLTVQMFNHQIRSGSIWNGNLDSVFSWTWKFPGWKNCWFRHCFFFCIWFYEFYGNWYFIIMVWHFVID